MNAAGYNVGPLTMENENWKTIAVTALPPGWVNVFNDKATRSDHLQPCPAILLQERPKRVAHDVTMPITRAVYAAEGGADLHELVPAFELDNYVETTTIAQWKETA